MRTLEITFRSIIIVTAAVLFIISAVKLKGTIRVMQDIKAKTEAVFN